MRGFYEGGQEFSSVADPVLRSEIFVVAGSFSEE
jgi:hypothetical protein